MAYTTVDDPTIYFNTVLYTGTTNAQSITGVGFQPALTFIKVRSATAYGVFQDSVRGATGTDSYLIITQAAASDVSDAITSFDSDGFSLGTDSNDRSNYASQTHVAWNWKAGTSFSNDASATGIGTIDSSGKVDDTGGFSIVSFTGTGSAGTIKHGLTSAPAWILVKNLSDSGENWVSFHQSLGAGKNQKFNNTEAFQTTSGSWNDTLPTSSVFSVGSFTNVNKSGGSMIAYCFAEKKGYSKFGSFTGNASTDGPFLYTGFKPAWFMIKNASDASANWQLWDNKRAYAFNEVQAHLYPNTNGAEVSSTGYNNCDFVSNGIKVREDNGDFNGSGNTVIWMAFAESPFVNSSGVPNNAR